MPQSLPMANAPPEHLELYIAPYYDLQQQWAPLVNFDGATPGQSGGVLTRRQAAIAAARQAEGQQLYQAGAHAIPYLDASQSPLNTEERSGEITSSSSLHGAVPQRFTRSSRTLQLHPTTPTTSTSSYSLQSARSSSPANSVASTALTSLSGGQGSAHPSLACSPLPNDDDLAHQGSSNEQQFAAPSPPRKKQKLFGLDRKSICYYAKANPGARQEDIAARYGVERSTISKILKQKAKWMQLQTNDEMKIAKHRPSKFPQIEAQLAVWVRTCVREKTLMTDALIRQKAKETARAIGIGEERFKASSGWIENFKNRHNIRRGTQTSPPNHDMNMDTGGNTESTQDPNDQSITGPSSRINESSLMQQHILDDQFTHSPTTYSPSSHGQQDLESVLGDGISLNGHRSLQGRPMRSHSMSSVPGSSSNLRYAQTMSLVDAGMIGQSQHQVFSPQSHRGHSHSNSQSSMASFGGHGSPTQQHAGMSLGLGAALPTAGLTSSPLMNQGMGMSNSGMPPPPPRQIPPGILTPGEILDSLKTIGKFIESQGSEFLSPDDREVWERIRAKATQWSWDTQRPGTSTGIVGELSFM